MGRPPPLPLLALRVAIIGSLLVSSVAALGEPTPAATEPSFLSRNRRTLLIATTAGAAASGVLALLHRRAANDRFEEYKRTADPDRLIQLYDETARLDNRAAAFFVSAEVLFVAAMYLGFFVEPPGESRASIVIDPQGTALSLRWSF